MISSSAALSFTVPRAGGSPPVAGTFTRNSGGSVLKCPDADSLQVKQGTCFEVAGRLWCLGIDTNVLTPPLVAGCDYAVFACADGNIQADTAFSAPVGYSPSESRRIGGFHVDLAGNINPYSLWDLRWRPACADPRSMALVNGGFWADIYLLGVDHMVNGTSKAGVTIADSVTPPKIPAAFGGAGGSYAGFSWWEANEVLTAHGKRLPTYGEFASLAYGVAEAQSLGVDPVTTQRHAGRTSRWGIEQASGVMWVWGGDLSFWPGAGSPGFRATTGGRGSLYLANDRGVVVGIFGGSWSGGVNAGSRAMDIAGDPWTGAQSIGARGLASHLDIGEYLT